MEQHARITPSLALTLAILVTAAAPAAAAGACPAPEARQFDFWVGEWDVTNRTLGPDGTWAETGRAVDRVFPVAGGCAIVELWQGVARHRPVRGFSVRAWDTAHRHWRLVLSWPPPERPGVSTLEGRFRHGRGEFFSERTTPDGTTLLTRFTFSDITERSLRWDAARSTDGGRSWQTHWVMEFSRRDPLSDPPLLGGPWIRTGAARHCSGEAMAALDLLAGSWEGVEESTAPDGQPIRRRVRQTTVPILGGCALMDLTEAEPVAGDGGWERFAVRTRDGREGEWLGYTIDTRHPRLVRVEELPGGDGSPGVILEGALPGGEAGARRRIAWRPEAGAAGKRPAVVRRETVSRDGGESWQTVSTLRLEPRPYATFDTSEMARVRGLVEVFLGAGVEAGLARLAELAQSPEGLPEALVNRLGYALLGRDAAAAVQVLRLNTERHPDSANAWDSLGEAYAAAGERQRAVAAYERSLELAPGNANARRWLERLRP